MLTMAVSSVLPKTFFYRDRTEYFEQKDSASPGEITSEYLTHLRRKSSYLKGL